MTALNIGLKHRVSPFEFKFENTDEGPKTSTKGSFQRDARVVVEQRVDEQCSDKYKGGNFNAMRASWTSRTWTSRERAGRAEKKTRCSRDRTVSKGKGRREPRKRTQAPGRVEIHQPLNRTL